MTVQTTGTGIVYEDRGQEFPLLFIHAFPLNRQMWQPQMDLASLDLRLLAPDLRGFGETPAPEGDYSMDAIAADCMSVLDRLEVGQPAVICGLSMGGYAALAFYRLFPQRVAALVLAATRAGADSPEGLKGRDRNIALTRQEGSAALASAMLPKMLSPKTYEADPALVEQVRLMMESSSAEGVIAALEAMKTRPDSTPFLKDISAPTLILHGRDDQLIPFSEAEQLHELIPQSSLRLLPDAGHLLNLEQAQLFNDALQEFLKSLQEPR